MSSLRQILCVLALACTSPAAAATLEGVVLVDGQQPNDVVVYLEAAGAPAVPAAARAVAPSASRAMVMDQKNLAFVPKVLPVTRGSVVEFTNSDDVQHNVFSPSVVAGKFNLGTYGPGAKRSVFLDQTGDVRVLCNIHMEMEAHILVLDSPYFSTVDAHGRYQISGVPAGTYTLKIWQHHWLPETRTLEVPATGTLTLDLATTH